MFKGRVHREPKVGNLESAVGRKQRVLELDVPVYDVQAVQVRKARHERAQDALRCVGLLHAPPCVAQQVEQVTLHMWPRSPLRLAMRTGDRGLAKGDIPLHTRGHLGSGEVTCVRAYLCRVLDDEDDVCLIFERAILHTTLLSVRLEKEALAAFGQRPPATRSGVQCYLETRGGRAH